MSVEHDLALVKSVADDLRPLFDELTERALDAERVALAEHERADRLARIADHRVPVVRNLYGWRFLVVAGPFVFGLRRR